ncbi:MAG: MFS transporter [Bythopirellula sp.]|nr:MFS transporter [Bythopirellula sp.]
MPSEQPAANSADRVPWNQLIAFGMGGLIPIALFNIAGQLVGLLGNISLGLSAFLLGTILIIPRLWDAISDPIIGHFSDNVQTRWGRRRPFILIGGIAVAVSFVAMWWLPRGEWIREIFVSDLAYNWFLLVFILVMLLIFFTACNLFEIPHGALGMEMSKDYHERTRLFSAKSFLGNLFALGTPWLIFLAGLEFFRGPSGDLIDGMRYVSLLIAIILIPMSYWWFLTLKEPAAESAQERPKTAFWADMGTAVANRPFIYLVLTIFTLAMGFNFVGNFNNYITIFYLYGGDTVAASALLGIAGTTWAITGLIAVFPLNWISKRIGKKWTLLLAIGLMCAAQLSKIVCYDPTHPYLVLIPTILLSAGMLMFFTLGASMVGDVCDEDELNTGSRREGTYYSVFWWFIKMGSAFASFVTGALLVYTHFDEKQNVLVESLVGNVAAISQVSERWQAEDVAAAVRREELGREIQKIEDKTGKTWAHFDGKIVEYPPLAEHTRQMRDQVDQLKTQLAALAAQQDQLAASPGELKNEVKVLSQAAMQLKTQAPETLYRLRFVEIGLPLVLSLFSIYFCLRYPLTEERCHEIKRELEVRHAAVKGT